MMSDLRLDPWWLVYFAAVAVPVASVGYGYLRYRRYAWWRRIRRTIRAAAEDMLTDVLVPDGMDGQYHVDFLLLTQRGILVLDLRENAGLIFGGDQMDEWTVLTRRRRYSFANPQNALFDRVAAVKQLVTDTPVEGRVVFTSRAQFPKGQPNCVLMLDSLQAEYAPASAEVARSLVEKYRADWEKVKGVAEPSDLKRY